jgi:sugar/nucleoside kinase (ribokinase family)
MINSNILVVGGANIEYILKSKTDIIQGSKNFVDIEELFGGSGVNYTLRLLAYNERVFPVLFMGDDSTGRQIYDAVISYIKEINHPFFQEHTFFVPSLTTPRSTIIVEGIHRTILSQDANKKNIFQSFVAKRVQETPELGAVIIGHIHNDREDINKTKDTLTTRYLIEYFANTDTLIYANFGASQLEYGFDFWKKHLQEIDILQLNIYELKNFLSPNESIDFASLIQKIRTLDIHVIITLDKFGAIGLMKGQKEQLFMARPINHFKDFVDSTGAGDAFCAGMVSRLKGLKQFSIKDFKEAMERGRSWATYACRSFGGANHCPNKEEIDRFHQEKTEDNAVVSYHDNTMKDIMALVDTILKAKY